MVVVPRQDGLGGRGPGVFMSIKALIFDVDGTIADTEETHRQAFNAAFLEHGLAWDWSRREYAELLRTSGGKERIAVYIDSLRLEPQEEDRLKRMAQLIHASKTRIYGELIADGRAPLRAGVARLIGEARAAACAWASPRPRPRQTFRR